MAAFEVTAESQVGLVRDRGELERLAAGTGPLTPSQCMQRAERAALALSLAALDRTSAGDAVLLWRSDASEAWLNLWWQPRDTGFHDHDGSCVGVYVIEGTARNEALVIGAPRRVREVRAGRSLCVSRDRDPPDGARGRRGDDSCLFPADPFDRRIRAGGRRTAASARGARPAVSRESASARCRPTRRAPADIARRGRRHNRRSSSQTDSVEAIRKPCPDNF